ncbi:DUF3126 family protein [Micavibrio aeruginosavorus]|uniref:DUF3126 domain-containing protein n=1 Tax=Micavibrio aeruginosavorus EPB TaxID=349215 RepID=M4VYM5_9BACT|nr:DUF3126 family protein [Micavibrio aeruginosavorus]AGH98294.1 hypothetical protein A11S_1487 [Micavibrio aeruginosavorus EPB]
MSQAQAKLKMTGEESSKIQKFLENTLKTPGLALRARPQASDSVEVLVNGEYIGLIHKDLDEGETSYIFTMTILDIDLEE